ncbi:MAG: T9SS type A sorting domain-containing protein [Candidatus Eisenbacteria bacterium]|nr:T9SS type A sorting domain-containing protein [Candidatus Eisenbacteria bacterium]
MRFPNLPIAAMTLTTILIGLTPGSAAAAWTHDPYTNLPVCVATKDQSYPGCAPDGVGGAYIAWEDYRTQGSTGADIYLQRVTRNGVPDPAWPVNGLPIVTLAGDQRFPVAVSDGAGGVIVAWEDHRGTNWDMYAQRVSAAGAIVSPWPANGAALSTHSNDDQVPTIVGDGAGGAYVAWTRYYGGIDFDPIVQHVLANGSIAPGFSTSSGNDIDPAGTNESAPAIASDDSGGVVVAYHTNASGNFNIRVARLIASGGTALWNVQVTAAAGVQSDPRIAADGHHGALVVWRDLRSGNYDVYGSHVIANGNIGPGWSTQADGLFLIGTGSDETPDAIVSDGAGGFYLYWSICSLLCAGYVTRVGPVGALASGWSSSGIQIGEDSGGLSAISDGAGGSIAALSGINSSLTAYDVAATRVTPSGSIETGWTYPETMVSTFGSPVGRPVAATDGNGGAIIAWSEQRGGLDYDIYAQRIERFGQLGNPEPTIASVKDVKNDQGGEVRVSWNASYLDVDPTDGVWQYRIWRQAPAASAMAALRSGAAVLEGENGTDLAAGNGAASRSSRRVMRTSIEAGQAYYWELVGTQPAAQFPSYSVVAATTGDSLGGSNPYTVFQVDAATYYGTPYWSSAPDSGYSVDNIPPVAPSPFSATYSPPNGTFASWGANGEADLAGYRLYRGAPLNFTPTPGNRIYQGVVPSYHDATNKAYIYKVCAYDIHGNEGGCSTAQPAGTLDAPRAGLPAELSLEPITPNPSRGEGANLRFGLPRDGVVKFAIYDAQGRRVKTLVSGERSAGWIDERWDGRDESGARAASGLYFVRLEAVGRRLTQRFVRLD